MNAPVGYRPAHTKRAIRRRLLNPLPLALVLYRLGHAPVVDPHAPTALLYPVPVDPWAGQPLRWGWR